jgi:hypothetical protein
MTKDEGRNRLALSFNMNAIKKLRPSFSLILFLILFVPGCGDESTPLYVPKTPEYEGIIVALGDSLT